MHPGYCDCAQCDPRSWCIYGAITSKYPMEPHQAQHLAAGVVNLDAGSSSAACTNICHGVHGYECIPWDTSSTLQQAEAALQLMDEKVQEKWMMLLEQDSSWVQSMSRRRDISCLWCTNGHGVCARQRLNFERPMHALNYGSAENAQE